MRRTSLGAAIVIVFFMMIRSAAQPTVTTLGGATFTRRPGSGPGGAVLDVGPAGGWMSQAVGAPSVIRERSRYSMWFTGVQTTGPGESPYLFRSAIGLATSRDGMRWDVQNGAQPVLPPGAPGTFDALATGQPSVLRERGRYLMWYGGADGSQAADSVRIERIGLAESRDGLRWTRLNGGRPVLDIGAAGSVDSTQATGPYVLRVGGEYLMWYGAFNGKHSIAAARSADGLTWTKIPVSGLGEQEALGPAVYARRGEFLMLYSIPLDGRWTMVAATSRDGRQWTRLKSGSPLLPPAAPGSFDAADKGQNHSVHPSEPVWDGRRLRIWYMAEAPVAPFPQRIGLMEAILDGRAHPAEIDLPRGRVK